MGSDTVFFQQIPYLLLFPVPDGTEAVDMTGMATVAEVSPVRFQDGIAGSLLALLSPLPGQYECTDALKPLLMA